MIEGPWVHVNSCNSKNSIIYDKFKLYLTSGEEGYNRQGEQDHIFDPQQIAYVRAEVKRTSEEEGSEGSEDGLSEDGSGECRNPGSTALHQDPEDLPEIAVRTEYPDGKLEVQMPTLKKIETDDSSVGKVKGMMEELKVGEDKKEDRRYCITVEQLREQLMGDTKEKMLDSITKAEEKTVGDSLGHDIPKSLYNGILKVSDD